MMENNMKTSPFNSKLHTFLLKNGYNYSAHQRYDRYDKNNITVFFYLNGYIMILDKDGEPAPKSVTREIMAVL
jgi:hypothetical protein